MLKAFKLSAVIAGAALVAAACTTAQAEVGFYNQEQVDRGAATYEDRCSVCHGSDIADSFAGWPGSAADLANTIIDFGMPQDDPGGLPAQDYVDIVAYILTLNGLPVGDEEVLADSDVLKDIKIEKK